MTQIRCTSVDRPGSREAELQTLLNQHADVRLSDGRQAVVRNSHLPERTVQTSIGNVEVKVPKVRDRSGSGIRSNSNLLPPYVKRVRSVEELLPWLYLKGISTGDFRHAKRRMQLLSVRWYGLALSTPRLWAVWLKIGKRCWLSTTFQRSTGCIFGPLIRLSQPSHVAST